MNDDREFLINELKKKFDEKDYQLIEFIIHSVAQYPLKSEYLLFETLIRYLLQREQLLEDVKEQPMVIQTKTTVKINPYQKLIQDLDEKIRILSKDLCLTKTSLKQSSTIEMEQEMKDSRVMIDEFKLLMVIVNYNIEVPDKVKDFVTSKDEVSKAELKQFCVDNNINPSFLSYIDE